MPSFIRELRNHIVTGFIFIMPVLVVVAVISKFWKHLLNTGHKIAQMLRVDSLFGPTGDSIVAVIFFLVICIVAGFLIRISFLKTFSEKVDQTLGRLVPGYNQLRTETRKKVGADKNEEPVYETCLVAVGGSWQPAYLIEEVEQGQLLVFVPEAPTFLNGRVYFVPPDQVRKLEMDSRALNQHLKTLGKGILRTQQQG